MYVINGMKKRYSNSVSRARSNNESSQKKHTQKKKKKDRRIEELRKGIGERIGQ